MSHHRFVLPRTDRSWLTEPAPAEWSTALAANHRRLAESLFDCQGRSLDELRRVTQAQVHRAAVKYTSELLGREITAPAGEQWVVAGHQPELYHVGVWVKNFAVARLARQQQAVGLNLVVDNDTFAGASIAVPVGTRAQPQLQTIALDDPQPVRPWEDVPLINRPLFDSFAARVGDALRSWNISPVILDVWPAARRYASCTSAPRLADCLTAVRAHTEWAWGAGNLELPLSQLEELPGFLWFTAHLLAQLPRFQFLHNDIVHEYRRRHRLRSRTHPVPDLASQDDWLEAPFWIWRAGDTQRDRLFARQVEQELWLRDRREIVLKLPLSPDRTACCAVEQLATLSGRGIRLRSRALTTTLFSRLFLADLFVHGIGGAKYDEMTDELISRFYGLAAPGYATISATLHLPLGGASAITPADIGRQSQLLWDLDHQPERFLVAPSATEQLLIDEKQQFIKQQQSREKRYLRHPSITEREENRQRFLRLREINGTLQAAVQSERTRILAAREALLQEQAAQRILGSREFSWVLFPEDRLRTFLDGLPISSVRGS